MIRVTDLTVGYGGVPVLDGLNFEFRDDMVYGILAKSGYGKSTLLKTIAGLLPPISGQVSIDDRVYRGTDNNPVMMMHQRYTNFNWLTCTDNILIAQRKRRLRKPEDALAVLEQVGLADYADRWPSELSGGMQQRLALARVLYMRPKYLLMDEPLSALDDATRLTMQDLVLRIHGENHGTIIMVTHSEDEARRVADCTLRLEDCVKRS